MWSQWPWVETMSFNVQSRAASSSAIHWIEGMAVSIAIASRERSSARMWTFVATGPTTRDRRCIKGGTSGAALQLRPDTVERLADHLVGGALDQPRPDARERPADQHIGAPVHRGPAVLAVAQGHRRGCVDCAARRL